MRVLLDTHIILWALADSPRLPQRAHQMIMDETNQLYFSAASVWEVSIKHSLSSSQMPVSGADLIGYLQQAGYVELSVTSIHAAEVEKLPHHHKDPFDRILIAQALSEPMILLTHDRLLGKYGEFVRVV